jgi:hypothetical protein
MARLLREVELVASEEWGEGKFRTRAKDNVRMA